MSSLRTLLLAVGLAAISSSAFADNPGKEKETERGRNPPPPPDRGGGGVRHAPELDPAGLGSVAAILVGATFLFGPRVLRRKNETA
jgi:hypothetical protein